LTVESSSGPPQLSSLEPEFYDWGFGNLIASPIPGVKAMTGSTVFTIDQHNSWRGTKTSPFGLFHRIAKFSSNCRLILNYLLLDGALNIEFQKDCLLISRKTSPSVPNPVLPSVIRPSA